MKPDRPAYAEYRPQPAWARVVTRAWERTALSDADLVVLPDGCTDVVWRSDGALFVAGPDVRPAHHHQRVGLEFVGVRLKPGTAATVLGTAVDEVRDQQIPLTSIWGAAAERLAQRMHDARTTAARRVLLADAVTAQRADAPVDMSVVHATELLASATADVGDLAAHVGISDRQLRRRFVEQVGYGPKTYERIMRFHRFLALAQGPRRGATRLTDLAARAGYADQAHLTRESRRLAGTTPARLVANPEESPNSSV